jgi:nitroreductase
MENSWPRDVTLPPADLPLRDRLRHLCDYARLAPSIRNSQPWRLRLGDDFVEVWADRSRALAVADPEGRGLTISCGAVLAQLEVAARAAALATAVERLPDPEAPDLLARLRVTGEAAPATEDPWLFQAIPKRRTHRGVFSSHAVSQALLGRLAALADANGAPMTVATGERRRARQEHVREAHRAQRADPAFREELAAWVAPELGARGLGLPGHADEAAAILAGAPTRLRRFAAAPREEEDALAADDQRRAPAAGAHGLALDLLIDDLDALLDDPSPDKVRILKVDRVDPTRDAAAVAPAAGEGAAAADDDELDLGAPTLAILSTAGDDPRSWLIAGETLARVLLRGRVDHLWASFLGQAIEVPAARAALRERLGLVGWPQLVLRLGYAGDRAPTPRRPLADQLFES